MKKKEWHKITQEKLKETGKEPASVEAGKPRKQRGLGGGKGHLLHGL